MTTAKRRADGKKPRQRATVIVRVNSERPAKKPDAKPPSKPKREAR